jgi:hypothetical protein
MAIPNRSKAMTGVDLITAERRRQIEQEGWPPEHDDEHDDASLALAAICYAAPRHVYVADVFANGVQFRDPWPHSWALYHDKRFAYLAGRKNPGTELPGPETYTHQQRISLLVKAGALIAAEIDRLERAESKSE